MFNKISKLYNNIISMINRISGRFLSLIILSILTLSTGTLFSNTSEVKDDGIIRWQKTTHNFGTIIQNKPVNAEFRFTNVSDFPVVITRVIPDCGCTIPKYNETPILPGQDGVIKTSFDAESRGFFNKKITVLMDVGNYEIYVTGNVVDKL